MYPDMFSMERSRNNKQPGLSMMFIVMSIEDIITKLEERLLAYCSYSGFFNITRQIAWNRLQVEDSPFGVSHLDGVKVGDWVSRVAQVRLWGINPKGVARQTVCVKMALSRLVNYGEIVVLCLQRPATRPS